MSSQDFSTTSARLQGPPPERKGPNVALIAVAVIAAIIVLALLFSMGDDEEAAPPPPTPTAQPAAPAAVRPDGPAATPEPQPWETDESFGVDEPTPTPSTQEPAAETSSACINFRWTAALQAGAEQPLDVLVTVHNNCSEDLAALSLVFEARGYREGQEIHTIQGSLYGELGAGQSQVITITLPATPGGFDRVDLQPLGGE